MNLYMCMINKYILFMVKSRHLPKLSLSGVLAIGPLASTSHLAYSDLQKLARLNN